MTKSRRELIVMGALTLERAQKAEQRAEAAEKQLAEARTRIVELEALVPDADMLERIADQNIPLAYAQANCDLQSLAAAIRKYWEGRRGAAPLDTPGLTLDNRIHLWYDTGRANREEGKMLTDEQREILPEWAIYREDITAEIKPRCRCGLCTRRRLQIELATALIELREAQGVLKDIEWCCLGHCPVCGEYKSSGHLDDLTMLKCGPCKLAKNLSE